MRWVPLLLTWGVVVARTQEPRKFAEERSEGGRFNSGAESSQRGGTFSGPAASPIVATLQSKIWCATNQHAKY